jgi:hypothetical protein
MGVEADAELLEALALLGELDEVLPLEEAEKSWRSSSWRRWSLRLLTASFMRAIWTRAALRGMSRACVWKDASIIERRARSLERECRESRSLTTVR